MTSSNSSSSTSSFGVREQDDRCCIKQSIDRLGYAYLPGLFADQDISSLISRLNKFIPSGRPDPELIQVGEHGSYRALFCKDSYFIDFVIGNATIRSVLDEALDEEYHIYSQLLIDSCIDKYGAQVLATNWHREIFYQHFTTSRPIAMQVIVYLDDMADPGCGALRVLPSSHLFERFPDSSFIERNYTTLNGPKGSVVILNSMCYHSASLVDPGLQKRIFTTVFSRPFIKQQFNYPEMLEYSTKPGSYLHQVCGLRWGLSQTYDAWLAEKKVVGLRSEYSD